MRVPRWFGDPRFTMHRFAALTAAAVLATAHGFNQGTGGAVINSVSPFSTTQQLGKTASGSLGGE